MEVLLGTLGYLVITFPYAVIWHMKLFHSWYLDWGYFGQQLSFLLGFSSMIIQGLVLSFLYQLIDVDHSSLVVGIQYSLLMGAFFWSCHVVAAMAKSTSLRNPSFFALETLYLIGQFSFFGLVISLIHQFV